MYEVKGRNEETKLCFIVETAADVLEAAQMAIENSMTEIFSVFLSKYREIVKYNGPEQDKPILYYCLEVADYVQQPNGKEKANRYQILIEATDFEEANRIANEMLAQGYNMGKKGLKQVNFDGII